MFKKTEPSVDLPLETVMATAVKAFAEPDRDLAVVREVMDVVAASPPEHVRTALFVTTYACARLADIVVEADADLTRPALIDALFEQIRQELIQ